MTLYQLKLSLFYEIIGMQFCNFTVSLWLFLIWNSLVKNICNKSFSCHVVDDSLLRVMRYFYIQMFCQTCAINGHIDLMWYLNLIPNRKYSYLFIRLKNNDTPILRNEKNNFMIWWFFSFISLKDTWITEYVFAFKFVVYINTKFAQYLVCNLKITLAR